MYLEITASRMHLTLLYNWKKLRNRRDFVRTFLVYYNTLPAYETCQNNPLVMLILACVDAWTTCTKHQIQICKQSKEVVREDFINSKEAIATESLQLSESDHMMNEYKMETRLWKLDLASRSLEIKSTALEEEGQQ